MKLYLACVVIVSMSVSQCYGQTTDTEERVLIETANKKQAREAQESFNELQGFLQALKEHDMNKAYYAFTTKDFRSLTTREAFQNFIVTNPVFSKYHKSDFKEPLFQNDLIIYRGVITSFDNFKNAVEFAMKIEDNQWKIFGIKVFALPEESPK